MNESGIIPMEYNVLVKPRVVEEKTTGGVYIPEPTRAREQFGQKEGTLVAMSPLAFNFDEGEGHRPEIGDRVLFSRYQADEVKGVDGETYWLLKDKSIAAVVKE